MNTLKKNKKALLCLALLVCVIASLFAVMTVPAGAADATASAKDNYSFSSTKYYQLEKAIPDFSSYTFETEFYLDPSVIGDGRAYNLIGNYADNNMDGNEWNIELHNYGSVRLYHQTYGSVYFGSNSASNATSDTDVRKYMKTDANGNPIYVKMTITVDTTVGNAYLYIDGNQVGSILGSAALKGKTYTASTAYKHRIGLDYRANTSTYFKGSIKSMSMYNYVRSAEEIANYGEAFTKLTPDTGLLFAYNFSDLEINGGYLSDYSANKNDAGNPNWTVPEGVGRTFTSTDALYLTKDLEVMPQTFEAFIYAPKTKADGTELSRPGVIFGNYYADPACLNFELHDSGKATIYLDQSSTTSQYSTKIADVRHNYGFVHVVIVRHRNETAGATYKLYVDGKYVTETVLADDKTDLNMATVQELYKFRLGGDSRSKNSRWFQGRIKNVALYSTALTAEEVFASYKNGVGTVKDKDNGLILNYDMTTVESSNYVKDTSGNEHHVTQGGLSLDSFIVGRGFNADDELYLEKPLTKQPQTYEAMILAPKSPARTGVMLGNYGSGSTSLINFEIHNNGAPSVYIQNENKDLMDTKFDYSINNDTWSHVVITHEYLDNGRAKFTLYVNGVWANEFETDLDYKIADMSSVTSLSLGRDSRGGNGQYFKGRIKNVALYSDVLTPAEIAASYENGVNTENESLMVYYNLQGTDGAEEIKDSSSNGNDAHSLFYENENTLVKCPGGNCDHTTCDYVYSFAVVGDTQKLVDKDDASGTTTYTNYIYDWLVANKTSKNIQFVMGLGDITENNTYDPNGVNSNEWIVAKNQILKLAAAGMKYSLVPGNHDGPRNYTNFNTVFGNETSLTSNITGYKSGTNLANYYMCFTVGSTDYMVIVLEYGPTDDVLTWAGDVIEAHPNHKVIITTHAYMYRDGTTIDINDVVPPREETSGNAFNNGDQMWTKLVSQYDNIIMALGGHDPYANISWRQDLGVNGNTVTQMLVDFQGMDLTYAYKTGMVAMLYFSADGKTVNVEYISTYNTIENQKADASAKDVIYNAYSNQFEFTIPDKVALTDVEVTINGEGGYMVKGAYSNEVTYPFVVFKTDKTFVGGYGDLGAATAAAKAQGGAGNYVILMRRDAEQNIKSGGLASMSGSITIDLGGHTLYKCQTGYIFDLYVDDNSENSTNAEGVDVRGTYTLRNGTVISYSTLPLVGINYGNSLAKPYSVSLKFDGITFVNKVGENHILATWENGYKSISQDKPQHVKANVEFNDCTFDYVNSIANSLMICLTNENWYDRTVYDVVVKGGKILSNTAISYSTFIKKDGNANGRADKVTFEKGSDGNYIIQVLPETVTDAALNSIWKNADGTKNLFVREEVSGGKAVYKLSSENINSYGSELKYGFVPNAYLDATKYPILLFKNGDFIGGYSVYDNGTNDGSTSAIAMAKNLTDGNCYGEIGSEAQILLRANATTTGGFSNIGQILGTVVIDLNGFTLTQGHSSSTLFSTVAKCWMGMQDATFKVFGGNIVLITELMAFDAYDDATYGNANGYKTTNMYFSDVNFSYASGTAITNFLGKFGESLTAGKAKETVYNVNFDNCVFDFTNASAVSIIMNANDSNTTSCNSIVTVKVNGGEIITSNPAISLYAINEANNSSVTFAKADGGNYTAMTVKNSTVAPTATANSGALEFVKISETADTVTYRLRIKEVAGVDFTPKSSITLSNALIYNVYVPVSAALKSFTLDGTQYADLSTIISKITTLSDGKQYYHFEIELPSPRAARDIVLTAALTVGEEDFSGSFTMSIPKYAKKVIEQSTKDYERQLAKDVLAYVAAAYEYFAYENSEAEITRVVNLVYEILAIGGAYEGVPATEGETKINDGSVVTDVTLNVDAKPTIRFYVTDKNVKFSIDGNEIKTLSGTYDGKLYVELDVYAYMLCQTITFGDGESYHISDFLTKSAGEEYENLVACFIVYTESAANYRTEWNKDNPIA